MHRALVLASAFLLAACATGRPETVEERGRAPAPPVAPAPVRSGILGLSAGELIQRFGSPALQIREGAGLKLQFRGSACILDAYLYPTPQGERVTYADARRSNGADADQAACIASLTRG